LEADDFAEARPTAVSHTPAQSPAREEELKRTEIAHAVAQPMRDEPSATVHTLRMKDIEATISLRELREVFNGNEWAKLMRNARDNGATSILACRILEKTMVMLDNGLMQVEQMMQASLDVRNTTDQLASISDDIKQVSNQSRIVSINASIEANRAGEAGRAFHVVAQEMTSLSEDTRNLTQTIDTKLLNVDAKIAINRELCTKVGTLFTNMNRELAEFKRFMTRVEELSSIQVEQLAGVETVLTTKKDDKKAA
jgi:methyl-accepting chemotaxis protein